MPWIWRKEDADESWWREGDKMSRMSEFICRIRGRPLKCRLQVMKVISQLPRESSVSMLSLFPDRRLTCIFVSSLASLLFLSFISSRYFTLDSCSGHRVHLSLTLLLPHKIHLSMQPAASLARKEKCTQEEWWNKVNSILWARDEGELKSIHLIVRVKLMCARHAKEKKQNIKWKCFAQKFISCKWKGKANKLPKFTWNEG